ncbi:MAG TPA: DUF2855 family protein [Candidatus Margulisiibacteriota bacterium]|nr:DUF2855 family protein [Candidatus Margulisiibacteriota bacterium]
MTDAVDFIVNRSDLRQTAFVPGRDSADSQLAPGQVLLRVDRFAFTANNVTYGAVGDMIGYWNFFPAKEGWGRIPVWGFGDIVRSRHDGLASGERVYGYFPMSTHLVLQAELVSSTGFIDAAPQRAALPPIYNQYVRVAADPGYDRAQEAHLALFRPLFTTAFLLDDFLADNAFFGARAVIVSSASSKTAVGLAFVCHARRGQCEVVGLTSRANRTFVERTGSYDRVIAYDEAQSLAREPASVFVDFAGNGTVAGAVHRQLGERLKYSCSVGVTHWEKMAMAEELPGPPRILFFAPDQAIKRTNDWGAAVFQMRVREAMQRFLASTAPWLRIVEGHGQGAVASVYRAMLEGKADPAEGHILSL